MLVACGGGGGGATVVEVPPPDQPQPLPQPPPVTVVVQPVAAAPMRGGEQWVGKYRCAQGVTDLVLHIDAVRGDAVDAVFEFAHGPSGAAGAYRMHGRFDANGGLALAPGQWMDRPENYVSVGMTGVVQGATFSGRIDNPSCGNFSVTRR